jgi:hypothetical protein
MKRRMTVVPAEVGPVGNYLDPRGPRVGNLPDLVAAYRIALPVAIDNETLSHCAMVGAMSIMRIAPSSRCPSHRQP